MNTPRWLTGRKRAQDGAGYTPGHTAARMYWELSGGDEEAVDQLSRTRRAGIAGMAALLLMASPLAFAPDADAKKGKKGKKSPEGVLVKAQGGAKVKDLDDQDDITGGDEPSSGLTSLDSATTVSDAEPSTKGTVVSQTEGVSFTEASTVSVSEVTPPSAESVPSVSEDSVSEPSVPSAESVDSVDSGDSVS